jgi:glycine/D-amino acid oxidase-like deaminating enzyme
MPGGASDRVMNEHPRGGAMARASDYDTIVVGGGFFGCSLAVHLTLTEGQRVVVLEREADLLQRASYVNQARVHNGYHYPRSLLTAFRCRVNFPRFLSDFEECIVDDFDKYYGVGRLSSKVTAEQYRRFCGLIGAELSPAPREIRGLFNPDLVEEVFSVRECAFDPVKLKEITQVALEEAGVEVRLRSEALRVERVGESLLKVTCRSPEGDDQITAASVLNCTYSRLNKLLVASGLPPLHLKHELTEMALVEVPEEIAHRGFTLMCGPFFSIMPFPPLGLHTLSHVRYTPHCEWYDDGGSGYVDPYEYFDGVPKKSSAAHMIKDAARYMPCLEKCRHVDSLWEVKTVLPQSEMDDSRPVLYAEDWGLPSLTCLMGGKIDNIYDIMEYEVQPDEQRGGA